MRQDVLHPGAIPCGEGGGVVRTGQTCVAQSKKKVLIHVCHVLIISSPVNRKEFPDNKQIADRRIYLKGNQILIYISISLTQLTQGIRQQISSFQALSDGAGTVMGTLHSVESTLYVNIELLQMYHFVISLLCRSLMPQTMEWLRLQT